MRLGVDVMMNKEKRGDANTWQTGMGGMLIFDGGKGEDGGRCSYFNKT